MAATLNQLGNKLLAQLYETVTGGDAHVPPSKNKFISWCCPGFVCSFVCLLSEPVPLSL